MLCLADRGFYSFQAWHKAAKTGADLCWRVKDNLKPESVEDLPDGSYLAEVFHSTKDRKRRHPLTVRVIEYTIEDGREPTGPFRLITTILGHCEASAIELAGAYAQRWEIESAFDELKTHQRGPLAVLRSKSPELVLQEIWGHLCCHYAIRVLMLDAGLEAGRNPGPDILRRSPPHLSPVNRPTGRFSPLRQPTPTNGSGATPLENSSPGSRNAGPGPTPAWSNASTPSGTSNDHPHYDWPQPNRPPEQAMVI